MQRNHLTQGSQNRTNFSNQKRLESKSGVRRYFNGKEKTFFQHSSKHYLRDKPPTLTYLNGELKRNYFIKPTTPDNRYLVPKLQKKQYQLQKQKEKFSKKPNKITQSLELVLQRKIDQKLEETGEDNVAVRTAHRSGQVLYRNKKTFKRRYKKYKIQKLDKQLKKHRQPYVDRERLRVEGKLKPKTITMYEKGVFHKPQKTTPSETSKKQLQKSMQKKYTQQLHIHQQSIDLQKAPLKFVIEEMKKVILRNSLIIGIVLGLIILILLIFMVCLGIMAIMSLLTMISYPSEHDELDEICAYLAERDEALVDFYESLGEPYERFTLTYEGTGVVATNKRNAVSYVSVVLALKDEMDEQGITIETAHPYIDELYEKMYTYISWIEWDKVSSNPDRWVAHLYVVVTCKTVNQVINEYNLLGFTGDGSAMEYYKLLNKTGGGYFPPLSGNPFPGIDWTGYITSPYGFRIHPITGMTSFHSGIDIGMPEGTEIGCVQDGEVIEVGYNDTEGYYITVANEEMKTKYLHCQSTISQLGDTVSEGEVIALVGNTGRSTGPHLHLSMWINGLMVDPAEHIGTD